MRHCFTTFSVREKHIQKPRKIMVSVFWQYQCALFNYTISEPALTLGWDHREWYTHSNHRIERENKERCLSIPVETQRSTIPDFRGWANCFINFSFLRLPIKKLFKQKGKLSKGEKIKLLNVLVFILRAQIKGMYNKKKALETRNSYKCAIVLFGVFHTPPPFQCP